MKREEFSQKIGNFWFYYKWYLLGGLLLFGALTVAINSCQKKENPDLYVLYARDTAPDPLQVEGLEGWLGTLTEDVNGDDKTTAMVVATSTIDQWNGSDSSAMLVQVNSGSAVLYLLNDATYETLHNNGVLQDLSSLGDSPYLEGDRFRLSASGALGNITEFPQEGQNFYLCMRKVEGTTFEGKPKYETQQRLAKEVIGKLIAT